jgi:hypothetical protein
MESKLKRYINEIDNAEKLSKKKKKYYRNIATEIYNAGFPIILNSYHLSNLSGIKWNILRNIINDSTKYYHKFNITKKDKISKREILAPSDELSHVQKYIKNFILENVKINSCSYGFTKNKNIKMNAEQHLYSEVVLNIDLKDFFPSIDSQRVYYIFNKICKYDKTLSYCLTRIVTYENRLPQGACTSPIISNIVAYKLDYRLFKLAQKNNIKYTRYADDITFSGNSNIITKKLYSLIKKIIEEEGFKVNEKKVHFSSKSFRQEVTGLIINNDKVTVNSKYVKKIEQELYYIKKYGLENHIKYAEIKNGFYLEHLKGKIMFVWSIDKEKGNKLLSIFNDLNLIE